MKRVWIVAIIILSPIVGIAAGTVIAWQVYPQRAAAADATPAADGFEAARASYQRSLAETNKGFDDASARGGYIMWGGAVGGLVGVVSAFALSRSKRR